IGHSIRSPIAVFRTMWTLPHGQSRKSCMAHIRRTRGGCQRLSAGFTRIGSAGIFSDVLPSNRHSAPVPSIHIVTHLTGSFRSRFSCPDISGHPPPVYHTRISSVSVQKGSPQLPLSVGEGGPVSIRRRRLAGSAGSGGSACGGAGAEGPSKN